jgi:hypothetical protein
LKALLGAPDVVSIEPGLTTTHYEAKMTGITEKGIKTRVILYNLGDVPPRIPRNIRVTPAEKGFILKTFKVEWDVGVRAVPRPRKIIKKVQEALR